MKSTIKFLKFSKYSMVGLKTNPTSLGNPTSHLRHPTGVLLCRGGCRTPFLCRKRPPTPENTLFELFVVSPAVL